MKAAALLILFSFPLLGIAQSWQPYEERHKRLVQSIGFSPDGSTLYFSLMHREYLEAMGEEVTAETPLIAIYQASWEGDHWGDPRLMPFSGNYKDYEPTLSPDGNTLYFNSWRPLEGKPVPNKNNIWYSVKTGGTWSEARSVTEINTLELEESYPTVTADGTLYFGADRPAGEALVYGLYRKTQGGEMVEAVALNNAKGSGDPWVSPDETYIIFTQFDNETSWADTCDLYISFRGENGWSIPQPIAALNTDGPDYAVAISPDEQWIYYRKNSRFVRLSWPPLLRELRAAGGG